MQKRRVLHKHKNKINGSISFYSMWKESMAFYRFRIWCNATTALCFTFRIPDASSGALNRFFFEKVPCYLAFSLESPGSH